MKNGRNSCKKGVALGNKGLHRIAIIFNNHSVTSIVKTPIKVQKAANLHNKKCSEIKGVAN